MDEADIPENGSVLFPSEVARFGVKELLATSAAKQSENSPGKQSATAKKEIKGQGCLQILKKSSPLKICDNTSNKKTAINEGSIQFTNKETMNARKLTPADEAMQVIDANEAPTQKTNGRNQNIFSNSHEAVNTTGNGELSTNREEPLIFQEGLKRVLKQNPPKHAAGGKSPTKSSSKTIKVLSNTAVHIPADDLKEMISFSVSQRKVLDHATKDQNMSVRVESQSKVHNFRQNLSRILETDKLFGKRKTEELYSIKSDPKEKTNDNSYEIIECDASCAAYHNNQRLSSENVEKESVLSHLNQRTISTEVGNQSCEKDLDLITDNTFHMTVNYKELSFSIREVKLGTPASEDSAKCVKQSTADTTKNEKQKAVKHNLQNLLGTGDPAYSLKKLQHVVPDSASQGRLEMFPTENMVQSGCEDIILNVEENNLKGVTQEHATKRPEIQHSMSASEKKPLTIDAQNNIRLNLKNILVTGDPFYANKEKALHRPYQVSPKKTCKTDSVDCGTNQEILFTHGNQETADNIFDVCLPKRANTICTNVTRVLGNTRNTNIATSSCDSSGNNKMAVDTSSYNEAETDIFEEYLSKNNSDFEGMKDNSLMKNYSVKPVSIFCNIEDESDDDIFEEYISNNFNKSCVDAGDSYEQHIMTSSEDFNSNEQNQLPESNSGNATSRNPINVNNSAVNSGYNQFSEHSEEIVQDKDAQIVDTNSIDYKNSTKDASAVLCLNGRLPILPEASVPYVKKYKIRPGERKKGKKDSTKHPVVEYLSKNNSDFEGMKGNSLMKTSSVQPVSIFCNIEDESDDDIFEEYISNNFNKSFVDARDSYEQHTMTSTEDFNSHEQKHVTDQLPKSNSGNATSSNPINVNNTSYNSAVNSGYNLSSGHSEKIVQDEDAQIVDTNSIDYKNSTKDTSLVLCLNGSLPILPEAPIPDVSKYRICPGERKKGKKGSTKQSVVEKIDENAFSSCEEEFEPSFERTNRKYNLRKDKKDATKHSVIEEIDENAVSSCEEEIEPSFEGTNRKTNLRKSHTNTTNYVIKFRDDLNPSNIVVEALSSDNGDSISNLGNGDEMTVDNVVLRFHSNDVIISRNTGKTVTNPILLQQTSNDSNNIDSVTASESFKIKKHVRDNFKRLVPKIPHIKKCHDKINVIGQGENLHSNSLLPESLESVSEGISIIEGLENTDLRNSTTKDNLKKDNRTILDKQLKNSKNLDTCNQKRRADTTNASNGSHQSLDFKRRKRKRQNEKIDNMVSSCNSESENSGNIPYCLRKKANKSLEAHVQKNHATEQINVGKLEDIPNIPNNSGISRKHISKHRLKYDRLNGDDTVESNGHIQEQISVETNGSHKNSDTPDKQSRRTRKSKMPSSANLDAELKNPSIHSVSSADPITPVRKRGRSKKVDSTANHSDENYSTSQETDIKRRGKSKNESQVSKKRKIDICDEEGVESISNCSILNEEDRIMRSEIPFSDSISQQNGRDHKEDRNSLGVHETISYQQNLPKKRGRPKKSAVETTASATSVTETDLLFGVSKGGRKRKQLDYSLIESQEATKSEKSTNNIKEENLIMRTEGSKNGNYHGDVSNNLDTSNSSSKYKWTGVTTLAVNQIFKTLQGKDVQEVSHDAESGLIKRKRGRTKKQDHLLDENGTSVCMVCHETIANPNWIQHKRDVHYNLTWRMGESPLDISDSSVILKAYKELQKEQKYLKCNKCGKEIKQVVAFVNHLEICNGVVNDSGAVVCAVCKKEMAKSEWQYHKYREHNNLAWREGDPPLNLQDQDLVVRILTQLYKAKKPLHCETCRQQKKSVMGYLSHKSICKLSQLEVENVKVACKICKKKVLPVSMESHMKIHSKPEPNVLNESGYFDVNLDATGPRKAAKRALKVIKSIKGELGTSSKYYVEQCDFEDDFVITALKKKAAECPDLSCLFSDCDFRNSSLDSMISHLKFCEKKPEQYIVCKLCLSWFTEEPEIEDHLKSVHNKIVAGDTDVDLKSEDVDCTSDDDVFVEEVEMEKKRLRLKGKLTLINKASQKDRLQGAEKENKVIV